MTTSDGRQKSSVKKLSRADCVCVRHACYSRKIGGCDTRWELAKQQLLQRKQHHEREHTHHTCTHCVIASGRTQTISPDRFVRCRNDCHRCLVWLHFMLAHRTSRALCVKPLLLLFQYLKNSPLCVFCIVPVVFAESNVAEFCPTSCHSVRIAFFNRWHRISVQWSCRTVCVVIFRSHASSADSIYDFCLCVCVCVAVSMLGLRPSNNFAVIFINRIM